MEISATIVADSIGKHRRITTLQLTYPRFIHGEVMTHRVFSRNAMSSRAVPVAKMIDQVRNDPFIPLHWGVNKPGMQADAVMEDPAEAVSQWKMAARFAADRAENLAAIGLHKQIANRLLEPFQWMHTLVTSTEWRNFFALRDHPAAEPHFQILARAMRQAMEASTPVPRSPNWGLGAWHLPYVSEQERDLIGNSTLLAKASAARCARVSYLNHDGSEPNLMKDLELFDRLAGSEPIHASPLEHQAEALALADRSGNFVGWGQFRQTIEKKGASC